MDMRLSNCGKALLNGRQRPVRKMRNSIPIKKIEGLELLDTGTAGVKSVAVNNTEAARDLSWDRYVRLQAASAVVRNLAEEPTTIVDAGGYDGALALFVPDHRVDLIDPATTGASLLHAPVDDCSYEFAIAVDVLEHIVPSERARALQELARIARRFVVLNYPCRQSKEAQELVYRLTNNILIQEHVQWELPDTDWVMEEMAALGFRSSMQAYGNLAIWLGQYLTLNLAPGAGPELNEYLIRNHSAEPFGVPLYHLVICEREKD